MFIVAQRNSPHAWQTDRESFVILDITSPKGRQKKQKVPKYRKISRKEKLNKSEVNYVWVKALQNNDNYKYVLILMYYLTKLYLNIARDVPPVLPIFFEIDHFNHTFSLAHIQAHTHKHMCMISTEEDWQNPGTRTGQVGCKGWK